jgi:hypothetical protein
MMGEEDQPRVSVVSIVTVVLLLLAITADARDRARLEDEPRLLQDLRAAESDADADRAARSLGEIASVKGLDVLIERRMAHSLDVYGSGLSFADPKCPPELAQAVEARIVDHVEDGQLAAPLERLVYSCGGYRSRRVFEAMSRRLQQPGLEWFEREQLAIAVLRTELPIEPEILDLLRAAPEHQHESQGICRSTTPHAPREQFIEFLGVRRHEPAVPLLEQLLPPATCDLGVVCEALAKIGTKRSLADAVACVERVTSGHSDPTRAPFVLTAVLGTLAELPPDAPLDFARLRQALGQPAEERIARPYIKLIRRRRESAGVADLLDYMTREPEQAQGLSRDALDALLDFESSDVWQRTLDATATLHQQGRISQGRYDYVHHVLDPRLADPDAFLASKRATEATTARRRERDEAIRRAASERALIEHLRGADPERYVRELRAHLARLHAELDAGPAEERESRTAELMSLYYQVAGFVRFTRHEPHEALAIYAEAATLESEWVRQLGVLDLLIADLVQHDLADTDTAIAHYRRALDAMTRPSPPEKRRDESPLTPLREACAAWVSHEIQYVETGVPFRGSVARQDAAPAVCIGTAGMLVGEPHLDELLRDGTPAKDVSDALDALPPSHLLLEAALPWLATMPRDRMLAFLARQDPGRYWTARLIGTALLHGLGLPSEAERSGVGRAFAPFAAAAPEFTRATGVTFALDPDERLSSPERTWQHFLDSLRRGDSEGALACHTTRMHPMLRALFSRMSPGDMREMADTFTGFVATKTFGEYAEYAVTRDVNGERRLALAYFVNTGGEWKIDSM